ncbi:hypothetical protein [Rubritalea tangerina]|uniref:TonB C-terminal domain-containing protein n=1 Tax=Rubritalea tangerina TaxID=430798 RepID=A0ABW4Z6U5_9BACT
MVFSRQKRIQRDREAGLVFSWRGGIEGNRGGMVLSLLMAVGLFAFAFWGISIDFKSSQLPQRKFAKILLLDEVSSDMALWVDQNSPFPSRWDPQTDTRHQARVQASLNEVFQEITEPPSPWKEMPEVEVPLSQPRLVERGRVELGGLPVPHERAKRPEVLELVMSLDALGGLESRQPESISPIEAPVPKQAYGSNYRFTVMLDADGRVVYCVPVEWQENGFAGEVENWLKGQRFKPNPGQSSELGEVSVGVEVKNYAGN